jgi:hypothetical protein
MTLATAAPITWTSTAYTVSGSFGQTLNTGQFATTGTQILAENTGGAALTFDGINFDAGTIGMGGGSFSGFHENIPTSNTLLARDGSYGSNTPSTVILSGLTSGNIYRVQALVYDGRGGLGGRTVNFDGISQGVYSNGVVGVTWGNGLLVTGTFTADAATQNFTIEAFAGATSKGGQLNALLVHEFIPGIPTLANPTVSTITTTAAQADADLSVVAATVTLHWDTVDQGIGTWSGSNLLGTQPIGPVSGAITGLSPDTLYFYRFHAVNTAAEPDTEAWSTAGTSFVTALTGLAPTAPSATTFSKTEIDVAWSEAFNTETGFIIERSPNGTNSWTQAGTVAANALVFYDSNLLPGTTYFYRVLAQNGTGLSEPSSVVSATTTAPDPGIAVQAWFQMGDSVPPGSNNLPTDSTVNARNFSVVTGAADTTISPTGGGYNNDAYYTFNGVDQSYNSIGYDPPENNVGVEVWVRTSDLAQANAHVFGTGTNANGLNIAYESVGDRGWSGAVANVAWVGDGVGTANYTANTWIHLALVRDSGTTTFYVNGVASGTSSGTPLNATQPRMAATFNNGIFFDGSVAEARIFTFDPGQFNVSHLLFPGTGPSDPYGIWAGTFPGLTNTSADLDFDNGGLATGIEWVTGGDPSVGSDDPGVTPTVNNTDPSNFLFTFRRRDTAASDTGTTIVVEYGSNLSDWRNTIDHGVADGITVDTGTDLGGGFHQVTVSIPRSLAPGGKLFARLKVSRP